MTECLPSPFFQSEDEERVPETLVTTYIMAKPQKTAILISTAMGISNPKFNDSFQRYKFENLNIGNTETDNTDKSSSTIHNRIC